MNPIRHIVLFQVYPSVSEEEIQEMVGRLKAFEGDKGILELRIERSLDARKGVILMENLLFQDLSALQRWGTTEKHREFADWISQRANWWTCDYVE